MVCKVYCPTAIEQDIGVVPEEGHNPYFFPAEGAYLPFFFTEDTFLKVFSALCNGAYMTYGDEGRYVIWEFLRNVEYPVSLCEAIAECIATNEATQAALRDFITSDDAIRDYIDDRAEGLVGTALTGPLIAGSCDPAILAGKMLALVDRLDINNKDALELIEVGTNDEEKVAAVLEGIPLMGELPIGDTIDFIQDVLEDFEEGYNGISTIERREELAEDLYCLALGKPECALSYADLFEFFQAKASSGLTLNSLIGDVVNFIIDGDFDTDDLVWYGMFAMQIAFIRTGMEFFGIDAPKIGALTRDAEPSSIWEDWDECEAPETRTPVINSQWDAPNIAGTLSGPDGSGFYTVTATSRGTDFAFVIMDVDDRQFVITDISYTFRPQCEVLYDHPALLYIACPGATAYTGQTVTEYWATWTNAQGVQSMQFKLAAP